MSARPGHRRISVRLLVGDFWRDCVYACRQMTRSPAFTLTALLSLALGIGTSTAIFVLLDAVFLRMLPVRAPQQLVEISNSDGGPLSFRMYEIIRDRNDAFSGVLSQASGRPSASARFGDVDLGTVYLSQVSATYFPVLGVSPLLGRVLGDEDMATPGSAVIGSALWRRAFAADPMVLGKSMRVGSNSYTIVGVAPPGFSGVTTGQPVDVWLPVSSMGRATLQNPVALTFQVMARQRTGVSVSQARANLDVLARQWSAEWRFDQPMRLEISPAAAGFSEIRRRFSRPLALLMAVVGLLLLVAAANIANLLLARGCARTREMAIRLSLGANRPRLVRQLLTESLVLGAAGAALGVALAPVAVAFLVRFVSSAVGPIELPVTIDLRILAFTMTTMLIVVLLFGLAPALAATRLDLSQRIRNGAFDGSPAPRRALSGRLLIVPEVALSCVLLVGGLLFARSLRALTTVELGFRPERVLWLQVRTATRGVTADERARLYQRVVDRIGQVPGVQSVALSSERLLDGGTWTENVSAPGFAVRQGESREAVMLVVSPAFFRTMRTSVRHGRDIEPSDDADAVPVAVVNEAMARHYFNGDVDVVGRTFRVEHTDFPRPLTVVGVVQDAKYSGLKQRAERIVYLPSAQNPGALAVANVAVRTASNPDAMAAAVQSAIRAESRDLRIGAPTTQARIIEGATAADRMLAQLSGFFALMATALVCLGVYGLTAYDVSRRTSEIAVRMALGAQRRDIVRSVVGRTLRLFAIGLALGIAVAVALGRVVQSSLFGVRSIDLPTFVVSASVLVAVGVSAAYWPARRATRLSPIASLKSS